MRREVRSVSVAPLDCSMALVVGGEGGEGEGGEGDARDGVAATAAFVSASASIETRASAGELFQRTLPGEKIPYLLATARDTHILTLSPRPIS